MVKKVIPINFTDQVWRQTVASAVMGVVGFLGLHVWSESFVHFGIGVILTGLTYFITLLVIGKEKLVLEIRSLRS